MNGMNGTWKVVGPKSAEMHIRIEYDALIFKSSLRREMWFFAFHVPWLICEVEAFCHFLFNAQLLKLFSVQNVSSKLAKPAK